MALNWDHIESERDRESVLARLSACLEESTPSPDDIVRVESLLRDTTVSNSLRREVSRALLKHTRRESTQRLPTLWRARSSDEEFRATDEMDVDVTAIVSASERPKLEEPTVERDWDDMPLPPDAGFEASPDASGILSLGHDALLTYVPQGVHTLRFHRRIYEGVGADGVVSLLRRGMLLGMDVLSDTGWERVIDSPRFKRLVAAFDEETERVLARLDVSSEPQSDEDLLTTSDITRPFDPGPTFPFEDLDTLFDDDVVEVQEDDDPDTVDLKSEVLNPAPEPDRPERPLPPGPLSAPNPQPQALPATTGPRRWPWVLGSMAASILVVGGLFALQAKAQPKIITATPHLFEAVASATELVDRAATFDARAPAILREAARELEASGEYVRAVALYEGMFDLKPSDSTALEIARLKIQLGEFAIARQWLQKATAEGADEAQVVAALRETILYDDSLREGTRRYVAPNDAEFLWDGYRHEFRIIRGAELIGYFVPDRRGHHPWGPRVAEYRICKVLGCAHRVARAFPAFVAAEGLELHSGVRPDYGVIYGAFVEAPKVTFSRVPIEVESVWAAWLSTTHPMPSGPIGPRLLRWDALDPDLRPDFTQLAGPNLDANDFARQISSLYLLDVLTHNSARTAERSVNIGMSTGFDGQQLVSLTPSSLPSRISRRLSKRVAPIERIDRFMWYALQAMSRDAMFGALDMLTKRQQNALWSERDAMTKKFSRLVAQSGREAVLLAANNANPSSLD